MAAHYPFQITSPEGYKQAYEESLSQPAAFWEKVAETFTWRRKWIKALRWNFEEPRVEWFAGGILNITENALDRHLADAADTPAILWEANDPLEGTRSLSYQELHAAVCRFAALLRKKGIQKGDRVCIYMGMVPELAIAMLACARVGAIHSVIFGGFSARAIADRVQDAAAVCIITANGAFRGAKEIPLKPLIDEALSQCPTVMNVIVHRRTGAAVSMQEGRDCWWEAALQEVSEIEISTLGYAEAMDAEDPLFILYTSGSTGRPKGVVHAGAGYMVYTTYTFVNVFQYRPGTVFFCTADAGWITGHSYLLYGPLCAGATTLMFEGIPTWPDAGRLWDVVDKHSVHTLYTAPTAIRSLMAYGTAPLEGKDLSSLRVLGTVGEPINEEAWHWYNEHVGKGKCPIVDTWWQTETGGIMMSNLAGITPSRPGWATLPMPGAAPELMDEKGLKTAPGAASGNLVLTSPWPSILRTTWGDHDRCRTTYFTAYPGCYFTGDGALRDAQGNYRITGRVDDVLNVSGHRIGTAEVENAIDEHPLVIESAVVGFPHAVKGQGIYAFVILETAVGKDSGLEKEIGEVVSLAIGAIARPDKIQIVSGLPKTRSGKIMRRILRKIAEGDMSNLGDTTTLLDPGVVDEIVAMAIL